MILDIKPAHSLKSNTFYSISNLYEHALQAGVDHNHKTLFLEDIVEIFYNIKLDYDEYDDTYIIYFKSEADKIIFILEYGEIFYGPVSA